VLQKNFPEYVLGTNVATTVADGDVLADSTAIIVKRVPDDDPALFCDDGV
jgi:hypothetical protein